MPTPRNAFTHIFRPAIAVLLLAAVAQAAPAAIKVGVGASVITPFLDEQMAGYNFERFADGLHDDLQAKAMWFDDGQTRVVLVACDLVRIPASAVKDARERIQKRFGVPGDHVGAQPEVQGATEVLAYGTAERTETGA